MIPETLQKKIGHKLFMKNMVINILTEHKTPVDIRDLAVELFTKYNYEISNIKTLRSTLTKLCEYKIVKKIDKNRYKILNTKKI